MTGQWAVQELSAGPTPAPARQWAVQELTATVTVPAAQNRWAIQGLSASVTNAPANRQWAVQTLSATVRSGITISANGSGGREAGEKIVLSALTSGGDLVVGGTWRVAGTTNSEPAPALDTSTGPCRFEAPATLKGTDITIGFAIAGQTEQFLTVNVLRSMWLMPVSGAWRPCRVLI